MAGEAACSGHLPYSCQMEMDLPGAVEAPAFRVCLSPLPHGHQGQGELPAGKPSGAPHRKFILQEHPIKWLMDSMRHKAGVKGA